MGDSVCYAPVEAQRLIVGGPFLRWTFRVLTANYIM
jgi:hypothetical protein